MALADTLANAAPPAAEFQRGQGPGALPYGEATQANNAIASVPPAAGPVSAAPSAASPLSPGPAAGAPPFKPANDIEKYLTDYQGPPMFNLDEPNLRPLPPGSQEWVAAIQLAAQSPTASPALKQAATNLAVRLRANG